MKEIIVKGDFSIEDIANGKHYFPVERADIESLILSVNELKTIGENEKQQMECLKLRLITFLDREWA